MNKKLVSLNNLPVGTKGLVKYLKVEGSMRRRMLDLGIINNTIVGSLMESPAGDPIAYEIRGAVIALRSEEASKILVESMG